MENDKEKQIKKGLLSIFTFKKMNWKKAIIVAIGMFLMCYASWNNGYVMGEQTLCNNLDGDMIQFHNTVNEKVYNICNFDKETVTRLQGSLYMGLEMPENMSVGVLNG